MKYHKSLVFMFLLLLCCRMSAQQLCSNIVKVPFCVTDTGQPTPIKWGMDTAWDDEGNVLRGINFIGADRLTYGRVSFQVMDPVNADGTLSARQQKFLQSRLQHIALSKPTGILLNSDPVDINVDIFTHHPEQWYKVIKATVKYVQDYGLNVVSIAPFNEPDVTASNQGTKDDFKAVAKLLKEDPELAGIRICAGNTCNNDGAMEWYQHMKPYVDEGNTHQLAGDFDHYADFYTTVKADGNVATNDELHNVMEGIVGAQYGLENGIWWGTVGPTRGDFCLATSPGGMRLGYGENRAAWTGAAVYRMPDGRIKAFAGASERQASPCTYELVSTDKAVYFDGYGPAYTYPVSLPGGYRYGDKHQQSAERSIQICQGEDVPLCPLTGSNYIIVNKKSQKVLTILSGSTANSATVGQYEDKDYAYQQWTLEALKDNGGDLTGFYIHSLRNANMNLETAGFQVKPGATVSVYPVTKAENQRWTFEYASDGYYKIRNYQSGLYLEVAGGSSVNNATVRLCTEATDDHQLWKLLPIDAPCERVAPTVPSGLKATPGISTIELSWEANTQDKDFNGYMVLRGEKNAAGTIEYDVIGRQVMDNRFTDSDCRQNTIYYYALQSVDYSQNRSDKSEPVEAALSGQRGLVAKYDGSSASDIRIPPAALCLAQATIAAWVYNPGRLAENSRLFDFAANDTRQAVLFLNQGGNIVLTVQDGEHVQTISGGKLPEGWHHVAVTIGEGMTKVYLDGEPSGTGAAPSVGLADIRPVCNYIGRGQDASVPPMDGRIDDLRIYNYALSPAELQSVMGETSSHGDENAWPEPVLPSKTIAEISSAEVLYLYNVDADAFVTYGMSWNTQSVAQRLAKGDRSLDNRFRVKVTKLAGGKVRLSMADKANAYIGCLPDACNVWSDRSAEEATFTWQETSTAAGSTYALISNAQKDYLDVSYAYGGPLTTRHGRGFTRWAFIAPKEISSQSYAKYKERQKLFALRQAIADSRKEEAYAANIQAAAQVYLNADATVAELRAATRKLVLAVAEGLTSSIDASCLFDNADMLGNATTTDWTTASTTIKDGNIEMFHKPFTLTQTQTDLPLGIYDIVLHAFYRNDNADKVPVVTAEATNTVTGTVVERQTVADNEVMMTAAETTAGAAQTLTSDLAQTVLKDAVVDNHQMTLSATISSSTQWVNFQGFEIKYRQPFVTVEIPQSGYTTFYYSDQSFLLPEGMEAYTFRETTQDFAVSQHFTAPGTVLPAGQAVVLGGQPGRYTMLPTTKKKSLDSRNQLRGSDEDQLTHGGTFYYTLCENENHQMEWNWTATDGAVFKNPAHKAYLISTRSTKQPSILAELPSVVQAIQAVQTENRPNSKAIYNLAGQQVKAQSSTTLNGLPRGIYIVNGKKVVR